MAELVKMRALRPWRNPEHEGQVAVGDVFFATEQRARDLEKRDLAVRKVEPPRVAVTADPAWGIETRPLVPGPVAPSSSSPPAPVRRTKTSRRSAGVR